MTDLALLYVMAVIDGMFVGYRDALGRNPRLDKRRYYLRAMFSGIGLVHVALAAIALTVAATFWLVDDVGQAVVALEQVASSMRVFYAVYAGCVALVFGVYALPSYDLRSYITVSAFGTLTLVRPLVIIAVALVAGLGADHPVAWPTCVAVALSMALLQPTLALLGWNRFDWSTFLDQKRGAG
ncbi:MAG: hypothetical protein ACLFVJ_22810 [Persicimonas sp.]